MPLELAFFDPFEIIFEEIEYFGRDLSNNLTNFSYHANGVISHSPGRKVDIVDTGV